MVGLSADGSALRHEGVVVLRAPHAGSLEAGAELHPLHGGDGEQGGGELALQPLEHGVSQPHRHPLGDAFHHTAHRVPGLSGLEDGGAHVLPGPLLQYREGGPLYPVQHIRVLAQRIKGAVLHGGDGADVGPDADTPASQDLDCNAPGDAQGGGDPAGEVAAPPHVLAAAVLHLGGEIGVGGPGLVPELVVVFGAGVGVLDDGSQRSPAGDAVHQTAQNLGHIPLLPGGGGGIPAGSPALEEALELLQVHRLPGGQAVHRHPDGRGVGLAEHRHVDVLTEVRGHELPLPTV